MKQDILRITFGLSLVLFAQKASAQCPIITCNGDTTATTDASSCDAIVNYAMPTAVDTCPPTVFQTFEYTGAQQTFIVPNGVTMINVDAYGAQGGSNSPSTNINYGGRVQADIAVTPGTTIYIYVGEQPNGLTGGWNGGGNGETAGQGGGGASDIRIGGTTLNDRVVVAGGAGGGGFWNGEEVHGGIGGGLTAGPGYRTDLSNYGGDPGTQTSSGVGTCISFNNPSVAGGFGYGGAPSSCGCEGYGGGGGWYGGAGSGNCRGGGGGSSYTDPAAINVIHTQGVKVGHGSITISWSVVTPAVSQIAGLPSGSAFPVGTTVNTFVAEAGGNTDTCSYTVTVIDNEAPTIVCPSANVEVCEGTVVSVATPATEDNCAGETVTYSTSGATTVSGSDSITGIVFNPGTTAVWYMVTDAAGNQDSCSFDVIVAPTPLVALAPFSSDSLCNFDDPVALPVGTPASGTYSGTGISGSNFDPAISGDGTFYIVYSYTDSMGCVGSDSTAIVVDGCASTIDLDEFSTISVYPNPTDGIFSIRFNSPEEHVTLKVMDASGKLIDSKNYNQIDLIEYELNQPSGIYLIEVSDGRDQRSLIRFIKD